MKRKGIVTMLIAIVFLFVTATSDLSAVNTVENSQKDLEKAAPGFTMSINNADVELMQDDLILSNIDGGGQYYQRSLAWLWISLAVLLVLILLLALLYDDSYYYWW